MNTQVFRSEANGFIGVLRSYTYTLLTSRRQNRPGRVFRQHSVAPNAHANDIIAQRGDLNDGLSGGNFEAIGKRFRTREFVKLLQDRIVRFLRRRGETANASNRKI